MNIISASKVFRDHVFEYVDSGRISACAILAIVMVVASSQIGSSVPSIAHAAALNYSCGNGTSGHCYGEYDFNGLSANGAYVNITVVHLYTPSGNNGFVTDEMWLAQNPDNSCTTYNTNACWVEVGMMSLEDSSGNTQYFWADNRPGSGGFNSHDFGSAPSADYGHVAAFIVDPNASGSCPNNPIGSWLVKVDSYSGSWQGSSTSNKFCPNWINEGTELAGSGLPYPSGSNAPDAYFTLSEYRQYSGNWVYQSGGYTTAASPPWLDVVSPPSSSNYGGNFYTYSCG